MERATKAEVHAVFTRLCASVGVQAFLPGGADGYYRDGEGMMHHAAGWSLDHSPTYGGYKIASHSGTGTGEDEPMGSMRMSPREFVTAMHFALRALEARDAHKRA